MYNIFIVSNNSKPSKFKKILGGKKMGNERTSVRIVDIIAILSMTLYIITTVIQKYFFDNLVMEIFRVMFAGTAFIVYIIMLVKECMNGKEYKAILYLLALWVFFFLMIFAMFH